MKRIVGRVAEERIPLKSVSAASTDRLYFAKSSTGALYKLHRVDEYSNDGYACYAWVSFTGSDCYANGTGAFREVLNLFTRDEDAVIYEFDDQDEFFQAIKDGVL